MKNYNTVSLMFLLMVCLIFPPPAFSAGEGGEIKKSATSIRLAKPIAVSAELPGGLAPPGSPLSGSIAYAENLWNYSLYSFDVDLPTEITTIGSAEYLAFCGDFAPGDTNQMWIIDYLDDSLKVVDIATGAATFVVDLPCPLADGLWSSLSIHKSTGQFFAIATDETQSILYAFDPSTGAILSELDLELLAVISSSFDALGTLYIFDIDTDYTYAVDISSGIITELGAAGFDGNYAQGMGYDPDDDEVYLAAYEDTVGPQLRRLDRTTGNTILLANLPGETGAFGFPVEFATPYANAGSDATINQNQTWLLSDAAATNYSSLLWTTSGDGSFIDPGDLNPTYYPGAGDILSGSVQLCLTAMPLDPVMDPVVDCMTLTIHTVPSGLDFGDAPESGGFFFSYPTTLTRNGARHVINPDIFLGYYIDGEPDGQPSPDANGDDAGLVYPSPYNDEDGVTLPDSAAAGSVVTVNVVASVNGYLDAWMDFDLDNTWYAPNEHIFSQEALNAGMNTLTFVVPVTSVPGQSYLRFRFRDYNSPIMFDGLANNGEVEDYTIMITENTIDGWDFGDAPEGDDIHFYPTLLSSNGARHHFVPGIHLGTLADVEPDGQPNTGATGDDTDLLYPSLGDDEDGVVLPASVTPGSIVTITVNASVSGYLDAWMDYNQDGTWNNTDEHIFTVQPLYGGMNPLTFTVPTTAIPGQSYLRFRFRNYDSALSFDGVADNGEVEDYSIEILDVPTEGWDYGDAPDGLVAGMFPTLLSSSGARHAIVPGIYLGNKVDAEPDGQPDAEAGGDDVDVLYPSLGDDEDGVIFTSVLATGKTASLNVTASTSGFLDAWMDFNGDGTWSAANEHIFTSLALAAGTNNLSFFIPASSVKGVSFARFRFRNYDSPLSFYGLAENGEVEDYKINIVDGLLPFMDFGDAPEIEGGFFSYPITIANNGARHIINPEIFLGNSVDGEPDGQPSTDANGDDNDLIYPSSGDDEDGVILPDSVLAGSTVTISVTASVAGYVDAWMDFNHDHNWLSPAEHIFVIQPLTSGINTLTFSVPDYAAVGQSYLRFRFRDYDTPLSFDGIANNGEVEDYTIEVIGNIPTGWDFGDAPDGPYPTLLTNDGARHLIDGMTFLGNSVDVEPNGIQSYTANGDDLDNQDDEDGIQFISTILCNNMAAVEVNASVDGYLNAWMDFDKNGSWAEADEQIFTDTWLVAGSNSLTFTVPPSASTGNTFARFRFSTQGGLTFTGIAENGEVEDYQVFIYPDWSVNQTIYSHIINIPAGLSTLNSGDLLGVFFMNNLDEEQCGGVVEVDANQMNMMFAFGDDLLTPDIKEGFEEGELLKWKLFSSLTGTIQDVDVDYDPLMPNSDGKFYSNGFSALTDLIIPQTQNLSIPKGWSGISTYIEPADINVGVMFNSVMSDLDILMNMTDIYWPIGDVFTLTTWDVHSGYVIKLSSDDSLSINGYEILDETVNLNQGWNLLPVLSSTPYDIENLFEGVAGFIIAKDVAGSGVYWPAYNINTIGNAEPGKAYFVRMNTQGSIDYAISGKGLSTIKTPDVSSLLTPWNQITQSHSSHIVAFELSENVLLENDIIGGFTTDGKCAGLTIIRDESLPFAITLNADDPYIADKVGFTNGELLAFRLFRTATGEVFDLEVSYKPFYDQSGLFVPNGMTVVNDVKLSSTGITNSSLHDVNIYPNPTAGTFTIEGIDAKINVRIFNAYGEEVYLNELGLPAKVDLSTQPGGIYFIRVETDNSVFFEKLVIN